MAQLLAETVLIDSFDLSSEQFPADDTSPTNLHFHIHDALQPFPKEHLHQYDIVSIRIFLTLADSKKAQSLLSNIAALLSKRHVSYIVCLEGFYANLVLEPGGFLQWLEPDMLTTKPWCPKPSVSTAAIERMIGVMKKPHPDAEYK